MSTRMAILLATLVIACLAAALYGRDRRRRARDLRDLQLLLRYSRLSSGQPLLVDKVSATLEALCRQLALQHACLLLPDRDGRWALYRSWPSQALNAPAPLDPAGPVAGGLRSLPQGMDAGGAALLGADAGLCREFLALVRGQVAFGLPGPDGLQGALVLGPLRTAGGLSAEQLRFVGALAGQLATMVEASTLQAGGGDAGRLNALGTLAANLAHELRNPLASISMFVQMLPQRGADPEFMQKFNRIVPGELKKLTGMTDQLLDLARPATRAPRVVDLGVLCLRLHPLVGHQFRKSEVLLSFDAPEGVLVPGGEEELSQALISLLWNAQRSSPKQGSVMVRLRAADGWAQLRVDFQGSGLFTAQLERIFRPFYSVQDAGLGLSLAASRSLVQRLGGELLVEDRPEGGAGFIIRLPLAGAMRADEAGLS